MSKSENEKNLNDGYEKIRKALAMNPTPGPWDVWDADSESYITARLPENEGHRWNDPTICHLYEDVTPCDSVTFDPWLKAMPNAQANGSFIAACDPGTIRALLDERDALREALETMVEMVEMNGFGRAYAMDVARAALKQEAYRGELQ